MEPRRMKTILLIIIGFILLLPFFNNSAFACECVPLEERISYLLDSDYIFSGTVKSIENQNMTFPSYVVAFDVNKIWQGANTNEIKIISSLDSGMCAYPYQVNQTVIVHALNGDNMLKEKGCGTLAEEYVLDYKIFLDLSRTDIPIKDQNIQRFTFNEEGKSSTVSIRADPGTKIISLDFDKNSKTLSFLGENEKNNQGQFEIVIPSELLSGNILIKSDGDSLLLSEKDPWGDTYGPFLDSNAGHSYGIIARKNAGYTDVFYYTLTPGEKKVEIVGTTVIPEFGIITPVILIASASSIVLFSSISKLRYQHNMVSSKNNIIC